MILIQVVLIIAFVVLLSRFIASPNSNQMKAWTKIIGVLFVAMAIVAILVPDILNRIAHVFGVGRGADLLLYVVTLCFIFSVLSQYITAKQEQRRLIKLARKVAILETELRQTNR